ncbi:DUF3419 family protein [Novosphingobium sp. FSY-8]|uniref:DUF3419 family protein n=1 Tax=Novosphingobium ovatum TaxID=1908523 RepID=A0ABW9XAM1_9SPHN|nr:DUF3419 family protein [Novosphingobium ovatum]NBC35575.1 DUF3419 family protein [Novosphingobium ovatum]
MTATAALPFTAPAPHIIDAAVVRHHAGLRQRLMDRAFALAFRGLVYAQIWEDPVVDMQALDIQPGDRIVTIASGSCNALSYLVADPAQITAVDLNTAHIALGRLKQAAFTHLPDYAALRRFLIEADHRDNPATYASTLAPHLDEATRRYWQGRDAIGRRRIGGFARGIYRRGLLGHFIGAAHLLARAYGVDLRAVLAARDMAEQRAIFDATIAPLFDKAFIRWLTNQPASLFGLGIPPAQFDALAGDARMAHVLRARLEQLACGFPITDNYFAWQAFNRGYGRDADAPLPPCLQAAHYDTLRDRVGRVEWRHTSFTDHLRAQPAASVDRYILLDAQDWMDDAQLTDLWAQITRTARPNARVLFRTAAEETLLPGRVPDTILSRWAYDPAQARALVAADRSSIYGGLHLYRFAG